MPETFGKPIPPPVTIARDDHERLRRLAAQLPRDLAAGDRPDLRGELDRAIVVEREFLPPGIVAMNSRVRFRDLESGATEEYVLTWPEQADASARRLSVLAPVGTALLGLGVGSTIEWPTPGGIRRLEIEHVEPAELDAPSGPEAILARVLYGGL